MMILKEGNFYRNYVDAKSHSQQLFEHTELKNHDCDQEQSLLDDKGLIRPRSLMDLPNISRFREDLVMQCKAYFTVSCARKFRTSTEKYFR